MLGKVFSLQCTNSNFSYPAFLSYPKFPGLRYTANQTRIRLERMAYLTLHTLAF